MFICIYISIYVPWSFKTTPWHSLGAPTCRSGSRYRGSRFLAFCRKSPLLLLLRTQRKPLQIIIRGQMVAGDLQMWLQRLLRNKLHAKDPTQQIFAAVIYLSYTSRVPIDAHINIAVELRNIFRQNSAPWKIITIIHIYGIGYFCKVSKVQLIHPGLLFVKQHFSFPLK